jgi:hypothetical protein
MVIFGAGVVTGGLLVNRLAPHPAVSETELRNPVHATNRVQLRNIQPLSSTGLKLELLRRVERELDLRPEQREQVDRILGQSQERTRHVMEPLMPRLREELQRTKSEFRSVLDSDQQARFDEMLKQQRMRRPGAPRGPLPDGATYPPLSNEPAGNR